MTRCRTIRSQGKGLVLFLGGILIAIYGWRNAYLILGALSLVVLAPVAWLVRSPPGLEEAKTTAIHSFSDYGRLATVSTPIVG